MRSGHTSRELWSLDLNTLTWERVETNQVTHHITYLGKKSRRIKYSEGSNTEQCNSNHDDIQTVTINGIESKSDITKVKKWLQMYGDLQSEITENYYQETSPEHRTILYRSSKV